MAKQPTETMELAQASQTIKWLDEERRKDKAIIATLQETMRSQDQQLTQQAAQIQELQTALAGMQSLISQVTGFEQVVANYKSEMVFLLDQREDAWKKDRAEAERLRKIEAETVADQLSGMEKSLRVLPRYDEDLKIRQAEDKRLSEALQRLSVTVSDLSKRSDDRVQAVTYLEEQRRADNRRIAELEQDETELRKKGEAQAAKLPLLEETIQKQKARIDEAIQQTKEMQKPIEELRISDFQREQKMKQYLDQGEQVSQEMERIRVQTQGFVEQQQLVKRALDKLEGLQARLEKRQNEVAEMQRLAEDRVKRQWEEWQAVQDKEQKKRQILSDEQWRAQNALNQEHADHAGRLETRTATHQTQLEALFDMYRMDAHRELAAMQEAVEHAEQIFAAARAALRGEQKQKGRSIERP
jgi:chromosome segregation ATPase